MRREFLKLVDVMTARPNGPSAARRGRLSRRFLRTPLAAFEAVGRNSHASRGRGAEEAG
jgi:hypothetical protein